MTLDLTYLDQPYDQLGALEADPAQVELLAAVNAVLRHIAASETIGTTTWVIDNEDGHLVVHRWLGAAQVIDGDARVQQLHARPCRLRRSSRSPRSVST